MGAGSAAVTAAMAPPLAGRQLILGVTGGIAAYKAAEIASQLVQLGAEVEVIMTAGALEFMRPLTFNALTRRPVHTDTFAPWTEAAAGHVTLAGEAEVVLVAPATASALAGLALGLADDLLGLVALSSTAPLIVAPAMEHNMWHHPAVRQHVSLLEARGAVIVGPAAGRLASGAMGDGRLAPTAEIIGAVRQSLGRRGPLAGRTVVVTTGGTHEPLDPVRFLGNRSSGRMGVALAQAALDAGAAVRLIAGPMSVAPPVGVELTPVDTALEMMAAVQAATRGADALIMAAAVADFRPVSAAEHKVKKEAPAEGWTIELVQNPDIVAGIGQPGLLKVGFAAETDDLLVNAAGKLARKGLALIVANDAVATIGGETSAATLLEPDRPPLALPPMPKEAVARVIVRRIGELLGPTGRLGA